ncbi:head maturation protease, ClpP-related [Desulfosporosinus lacus]|uniref:ATP-dependent Clp protease proteolytic subunit n=1 Tax=Desulfosporosinus lacus DSM 15449 TaxID=1121420 RepID=A0A1M5WHB6_9FIRM|nr:head maturation protease, ClpP-related [Desulfosporosinus lacus]SHH86788.1 ATP-dependent Clp endopeptidase, proteolytic subunit ClpP [Desulfosporosinus lacus DSM 15449]
MKIDIKGFIVANDDKWIYDWFEVGAVCPSDIINQLEKANGEDIEVGINSPGGDVYAGSEIYTALMEYKGNVLNKVVAVAASAASIIAMAGKTVITPTGQIMIHNVLTQIRGNHTALEREAIVLKGHDAGIANAYMLKTGMSRDELLDLMEKETYFNAQEALKYKFVDEIMFDEGNRLVASMGQAMIPTEVINKMRSFLKANGQTQVVRTAESGKELSVLKAKLALELIL